MSELRYHALIGAFARPEQAVAAARELRDSGLRRIDAYTPYPVDELNQLAQQQRGVLVPTLVCSGAAMGALIGYFGQYGTATDYQLNIGGRPLDSWPAFIVSAFEITVLCAVIAGFVAFLAGARLPRFYHPAFAAEALERASQDRFLLCIEASDPHFAAEPVRAILAQHGAEHIDEVRA